MPQLPPSDSNNWQGLNHSSLLTHSLTKWLHYIEPILAPLTPLHSTNSLRSLSMDHIENTSHNSSSTVASCCYCMDHVGNIASQLLHCCGLKNPLPSNSCLCSFHSSYAEQICHNIFLLKTLWHFQWLGINNFGVHLYTIHYCIHGVAVSSRLTALRCGDYLSSGARKEKKFSFAFHHMKSFCGTIIFISI
jgi:hypothetical protein